jgi:type II secretory pathway pseudopilin PulG
MSQRLPVFSPLPITPIDKHNRQQRYAEKRRQYEKNIQDRLDQERYCNPSPMRYAALAGITPPRSPQTYRVTEDRNKYWVDAYVNDDPIKAFPDNGSTLNIVSEAYIYREGFGKTDDRRTSILLPNNKRVTSLGSLTVPFKFEKEDEAIMVTFQILRDCIHDFILSDTFLWGTQVFTKFWSRIKMSPSAMHVPNRVCFNGDFRQHVVGSINGHSVSASPDTGSNVNVIAKDLAIRFKLEISTVVEGVLLQLVDGSLVVPDGIVLNTLWRYGNPSPEQSVPYGAYGDPNWASLKGCEFGTNAAHSDSFICDFYVLESLTVPAILSSNLLYGTSDFTDCVERTAHSNDLIFSEPSAYSVAPIRSLFSKRKDRAKIGMKHQRL